jgi:hypothetical protein
VFIASIYEPISEQKVVFSEQQLQWTMNGVEKENGILEEKYKTLKAMRAMRGPEGAQAPPPSPHSTQSSAEWLPFRAL